MKLKVILALLTVSSALTGCNDNNDITAKSNEIQLIKSEENKDPQQIESSYLSFLKNMEDENVKNITSINAGSNPSDVITYLENSKQKLEQIKPLAENLNKLGYPLLIQRINNMSKEIKDAKEIVTKMESEQNTANVKYLKNTHQQQIDTFSEYQKYIQNRYDVMHKAAENYHNTWR